MRRMWLSSVVTGLLVLAPVAAIAQAGLGDDPEETEVQEVATEETLREDASAPDATTLAQEETTGTVGDGETGGEQDETTDTVDDGQEGDDPAGESNDHGERVSTVAQCAPTGKLDIEGFGNHGAFVRAVAQGQTIDVPGAGTFDLSTAEGVAALCDWAATYEPPSEEPAQDPVEATSADEETVTDGRPEDAGPPAHAGAEADGETNGQGNGNGKGNGNRNGKGNGRGGGR